MSSPDPRNLELPPLVRLFIFPLLRVPHPLQLPQDQPVLRECVLIRAPLRVHCIQGLGFGQDQPVLRECVLIRAPLRVHCIQGLGFGVKLQGRGSSG